MLYMLCIIRKRMTLSVTLTFDPQTWVLYATHRPVMVNICAKLFLNPSVYGEVMAWTQIVDLTDYAHPPNDIPQFNNRHTPI